MLHVGISYSFEKKKRLFIVDYIKLSPVYQVKCKLVLLSLGTLVLPFLQPLSTLLLYCSLSFTSSTNLLYQLLLGCSLYCPLILQPLGVCTVVYAVGFLLMLLSIYAIGSVLVLHCFVE